METNVVTLDTARKLKAAGFPQDTWQSWEPIGGSFAVMATHDCVLGRSVAAPTAQEIADELHWRDVGIGFLTITKHPQGWKARYIAGKEDGSGQTYPTLAEALAALWLKLQEAK
jgi:hypothetical protein